MFEELDVFAVVVEQSSINQASKLLNLSQPALSENSQAGGPARTAAVQPPRQRLELTSIGQIVYTFALEQRQQQIKFLQTLAHYREGDQISINLGASLTTLQTTLPAGQCLHGASSGSRNQAHHRQDP